MSVSILDKLSVGNKRLHAISFVASAAEENITTGLSYVDHFTIGPQSITSYPHAMKKNVNSSGTAANGSIGVSGLTSGDELYIHAWGR